ncbi:MAG: F0F1 ATP synthase subunit A [Oligoflexales bacterium]|nr:F0F1 ATP synthase subunit A [Oligoflexales bacterium]
MLDYYHVLTNYLGFDEAYSPILSSVLTLVITIVLGYLYKKSTENKLQSGDLSPSDHLGLPAFMETIMSFLHGLSKEQCGKDYASFLPFLSGLFVFILFNNLTGLVPGFPPSTESFSANLVIGASVFLVYNYAGMREHKLSYAKQFMGPFLILAPLFIVLELISHAARPLSLSFRLTANIFGDHLLLGVFSAMTPLLVPSFLLFFGLLVACVQSFVFTMLSGIYIHMAISHDH